MKNLPRGSRDDANAEQIDAAQFLLGLRMRKPAKAAVLEQGGDRASLRVGVSRCGGDCGGA
ncbi:MAG TPA: hypothetical protein VEV86_04840, partial [Vicinamibacterales bacterium]|nr:hypothetical protein [Vicinamibacterales bacterium]